MKRCLCVMLAAMIVLSGCQKGSEVPKDGTKVMEETERREKEEESLEEEDSEKEETDAGDGEEASKDAGLPEGAEAPEPINLDISAEYDSVWEEGSLMIQASSSNLYVIGERYEAFQAVLDEYNANNWREVQELYQEYLPQAREQYAQTGYAEYEIARLITLDRADTRIVSFTNGEETYLGGAHGSHYLKGVNFDPISGQQLSLKDVAQDYDQLYEFTKAYLEKEYSADAFFPDYQDTLHDMFYGEGEGVSPLEWSMDTKNLIFYFNQYVLGPYSSGAFLVEVPLKGDVQLVKTEYVYDIEGRMEEVYQGEEVFLDLKGDGQAEPFSYVVQANDAEFSSLITIRWGQQNVEKELYGWIMQAYLVQRPDGKAWFYVETQEENDWRSIHVFDLNPGAAVYVDSTPNFIGDQLAADPENFTLLTRMNLLGTYHGFRRYHVGDNGMPEPIENVYTILNYDRGWGRYAITSKVDLTVQMYADGGMRRNEEILPAGTRFYPCRTDGSSFVEMELEDGRKCDILLEMEDYFSKINGMDEWDCFDGLAYAG